MITHYLQNQSLAALATRIPIPSSHTLVTPNRGSAQNTSDKTLTAEMAVLAILCHLR
jgi:hypothetical protein